MNDPEYLTDVELAALLRLRPKSFYNRISAGLAMPPFVRLPGIRKRLWPRDQVHAWMHRHLVDGSDPKRTIHRGA